MYILGAVALQVGLVGFGQDIGRQVWGGVPQGERFEAGAHFRDFPQLCHIEESDAKSASWQAFCK